MHGPFQTITPDLRLISHTHLSQNSLAQRGTPYTNDQQSHSCASALEAGTEMEVGLVMTRWGKDRSSLETMDNEIWWGRSL